MKYICVLLGLLLFGTACKNDFLDTKPKGKLSDELLNTPDGIESLCVSAYAALAGPEGNDGTFLSPTTNWVYGDVRAETAYKGGGGIGDIGEFNAFETFNGVYATNGLLDRKWFNLYISVQRANNAIRRLNAVTEQQVPLKNIRLGEMRFLRAHFFFELSRLFNKIPYFDENVATKDYIKISNIEFTRDQILEKIAAEFAAAAELLPATQPEPGRATKYAAKAYEAKVTLYRAYKQNADNTLAGVDQTLLNKVISLCDDVIANGGYHLLSDFQQLSQAEYDNSRESVFAVQYSINDGTAQGRINWSNLLNAPRGPAYSGDGFFQPSQNLVNSYKTDANGLPLFDSYNNSNIMTVGDGLNNNVDPRLDFTVGRIGIRWKNYAAAPYGADWAREPATYGYYANKKALVSPESPSMVKGFPWGGSALNFCIIRYPDLLLWKAEALIELGRQVEAVSLINETRTRAGNSKYVLAWNNTSSTDYAARYTIATYQPGVNCNWTQDYARKALRFERKLEFAMEGERFFDLIRWGIAERVLNEEYFAKEKNLRTYLQNAKFIKGRDEYFPIPQAQINFSGGLYKQNPGYL
ncbi:RagB/SusD family nutrient uptake outer membrane protein [Pararcticibacter amylolyticus]|uniref:RagB/SusD family nutrient uptake outer membrane protein n=1 Tax=Pararcticibacter amylolyticus TaxID=2173175 RepID=A0A2U2PD35_9SPHI|nr:RagB/SusD family nutrient uptake outer membrane protein [Pararcticibacter amylolyticus]PWG79306.1 RagB/SusD family nutrient uptake outer membrane protein [Pararcticibacter amylolyticus]